MDDPHTQEPKYPLQTLSKALEVLEYMRQNLSPHGVTLSAISKNLNISKSSAHRLLDTLLHYGFVEKSGATVIHYQLSWALYQIGKAVPECHTLETCDYESLISALSREIRRRVDLCVRSEDTNSSIYHADPLAAADPAAERTVFIERFPLHATASGKIFMLDFTKEEILRYFQTTDIRRYTPNTILNYIDFLENLEQIREQGYSVENQEYAQGNFFVSMPVRDYSGRTAAAVSITLEPDSAADELPELLPKLARTCDTISAYLGYGTSEPKTGSGRR